MFKKLEEKAMERDKLEKSSEKNFRQMAKGWPLSLQSFTGSVSTSSTKAVDDAAQLYDSVMYLPNYGIGDAVSQKHFSGYCPFHNVREGLGSRLVQGWHSDSPITALATR
ncbi:hypothetical protein niasHS_015464 [Heterodera schachtii]|uniref:Uncharacterized protein n=1 Tax=Heterodera schachtii TaxID=97005 RepID=A0ABD2HYF4_HETSC